MKPLRVLHLEDTEADSLLVERALRKGGYDVALRREFTTAGFISALSAGPWDIILSDHEMGGFSSVDAFSIYQRFGVDAPMVLVSGHIGEEQAAEAMRQGIRDYVLKDRLARLVPAVERALDNAERDRETRRLQQDLRERARDLELFVRDAPASIAMLDTNMHYVAVSNRWLKDYGLTDQALVGRSHYEVFPEIPERWRVIHRRCLAGATERQDEDRFVREDGSVQWIRWEVRPWHAAGNRIGGIFIYSEDITESVVTKHRLIQNERMLSLGQSLAHVGTFWRDLATDQQAGTEEAYRILGPGSEQILASHNSMRPFIHPDDLETYDKTKAEVRRTGETLVHEFRIVHPDGSVKDIRSIAAIVQDAPNRPGNAVRVIQDITERKAAEREVRDKEWVLSRAQEAGQIGTWFWNADTNRMNLSDQTYRILGVDPRSWGHTIDAFRQLIHPEDREGFEFRRMKRREDLGGRFSDDYRIIRPDGSVRYVNHIGEFSTDEHGRFKGLIGIVQDITDRKLTEKQLLEKEWMLVRAQEAGNIGTWYYDIRTDTRSASAQTYAICGFPKDAVPAKFEGFASLMTGEDREAMLEARRLLIETGAPMAGDFRLRRPNGEVRNVHIMGNRLEDAAGRPVATIGIVQDITERKRSEGDLREKEWMLSRSQAIAHIGTFLRDLETGRTEWSEELYRICGVDPATFDPTADTDAQLLHPEDRQTHFANRARALADGRAITEECRIVRPDGSVRNVIVIAEPVKHTEGHQSLIGIVQDVTERKIDEGRLVQAQKLEAIGRLTAGVAHDFNNLLTIISGNLELMQRDIPGNAQVRPMLETVLHATQRGADLIRQMSAFNRKRPIKQRVVSPREVIDAIAKLVPRTLGEAIAVTADCAADAWPILVDGAQLESTLVNMAINARDAMPNGGRLVISVNNVAITNESEPPGDHVVFTVGDSGTGIPPELMDKIFEPFFTTKSQGKGSGLGLSMVFGFVKQSGGHLRVYSEVGRGTTFKLYFPRHTRQPLPEAEAPGGAAAMPLPGSLGPVLIVEDQEPIRALAVDIFRRLGFQTLSAADARTASAHLESNPAISLLFSDIMLPGGTTGIQLAGQVLDRRPNLPVLLTSGLAEETIDLVELEAKGALFLEKPYQFADVQAKLHAIFGAQRSTRPGSGTLRQPRTISRS